MTAHPDARIAFLAPLPPLPLRRNRETSHKGYRAALVRQYQEEVWIAGCRWEQETDSTRTLKRIVERGLTYTGTAAFTGNVIFLPWDKARLTLTWRHHRVGPDADNALASLKPLIDVLKATGPRPLGIFRDDSPDCLTVAIKVEKVRTKADEGILVEVERV